MNIVPSRCRKMRDGSPFEVRIFLCNEMHDIFFAQTDWARAWCQVGAGGTCGPMVV